MKKIISGQQALKAMILLISLVIVFHVAVLLEIIPYTIVWAGKLNTKAQMYQFETVSILINIFLLLVFCLKGKYIKHTIPEVLLNVILWVFLFLFVLNTVGNLMAETFFEKAVFTPLTFLSAVLIGIVLGEKKV